MEESFEWTHNIYRWAKYEVALLTYTEKQYKAINIKTFAPFQYKILPRKIWECKCDPKELIPSQQLWYQA